MDRRERLPGQVTEFPPWIVSAYGIAVKHGYEGTEREFALSLLGRDGVDLLPMLLVTEDPEGEIHEDYEAIMRPSSDEYAYSTAKNEFRYADEIVRIPDGFSLVGRVLKLTAGGEAFGAGTELPEAQLPEVSSADNGKIMKVISGAWAPGNL